MTARIRSAFAGTVDLINLHDVDIRGGCIGCIRCGYDNTCVYPDGYRDLFEKKLMPADIIIFSGTVHDRYLSSAWKQFFDRSFYHGHTPSLRGKQIGFVISGPLQQIQNLREVLTAWADNGMVNAHFVTDEVTESTELDTLLDAMAGRLVQASATGYIPPPTFYAVGGHKIFRDAISAGMMVAFQADCRYYAEHGMFDFPQRDVKTRLLNTVIVQLMRIPGFRKKVVADMKHHMIQPFEAVLKDA